MPVDNNATLADYVYILRRHALLLAGVFLAILGLATIVVVLLPPVYQAGGTILVESQRIPPDLVQATVTSYAEERIAVIRQRVMTRENLLRIADKYGLFKEEGRSYAPSDVVERMRASIRVDLQSASGARHRGGATVAFRVDFEHRKPEVAYRVANELVTLFLSENVKARTERAAETTQFLGQEADRLRAELDRLEQDVAAYKQEHANALPEHLDLRMNMLQRTEAALKDLEREYKATQEELRYLDIELAAAKAGASTEGSGAASPAAELQRLRVEYASMESRYTPDHPDLRAMRARIKALEEQLGTSESSVNSVTDLVVAKVEARIASAKVRLTSLAEQQVTLREQQRQLEGQIIQAPQVERVLMKLTRDHENARRKYEELRSKQMSAQLAENLEEENKAERFSLLEPPVMPDQPIKPNRKKALALGFVFAGAVPGGLVVLLQSLNRRVRGMKALAAAVGQPPLALIPYITTREESVRARRRLVIGAIAILLVGVAALAAVHYFYMSLDLLLLKIQARF